MSKPIRIERVEQLRQRNLRHRDELRTQAVNVWLVAGDNDVAVIDPAGDPHAIAEAVGNRNVIAVICTHGHRGHISAAVDVGVGLCAPILLHPADHDLRQEAHSLRRYWQIAHGDRIAIAGNEIHALHTPGHTPGSISLHVPAIGALLIGDALHRRPGPEHTGRHQHPHLTDEILGVLQDLPASAHVHPGHGMSFPLASALSEHHTAAAPAGLTN